MANKLIRAGIFDRIKKRILINRIARLHQHYRAIKPELLGKTPKDKEEIEFFCDRLERYYKNADVLINIRLFFYMLLYASLLVNILILIPFLSFIVPFIKLGNALFGTTIILIAVFLLSAKIGLYLGMMQDCFAHLVVFYHKNEKRKSTETLEKIIKVV